ncbi:hypothetical protein Nos7524_3161 [Nostoc sp. PCC 7524]|uniref:hypothetical protein n=1 Tax=Nostoc sp. (strain ATCC 29411 / PCC 7524) TaxID=28072 RepID=UPI00029F246D|nr:hypothetical protein [Nostoc sp. PCC 7524]AFY48964.1 hypothetical protein Nos7524_3161 [Nostoc sp. PCC 7524]
MSTIRIEDLNTQISVIDLSNDEINEVKGGCPVCLLILGAAVGYAFDRWANS